MRPLAALLLLALFAGSSALAQDGESPLARATEALWAQQGKDGGWHSQTYALLRSGQALSPFVLRALLDVPESVSARPKGGVERALAFLRARVNTAGRSGFAGDRIEYPTYATSYSLQCLVRAGQPSDRDLIQRMARALVQTQYAEPSGFSPKGRAYGGWGFGGTLPPGDPGHMDLAHTRAALEALAAARACSPAVQTRAEAFLRLVQKDPQARDRQPPVPNQARDRQPPASLPGDGGFYFTPVALLANKGRHDSARGVWRSYATATCDGLLALLAAGAPPDDPRVVRARDWLWKRPKLTHPAGVPANQSVPWGEGIHYYHLAVRAEAYRRVGGPNGWQTAMRKHLAPLQRKDGSFKNPSSLMKEDDPILCTALAVIALRSARAPAKRTDSRTSSGASAN